MKSFLQICQSRRSIRQYTNQPVEREKLERILQCALMSPSGKRINPWQFWVLTNEAQLRPLAQCKTYGSGMFSTAMAGIVVAVDASLTDTWAYDGAIAAEHLLLAAADEGLGACWCQIAGREESERLVREVAGVPDHLTVICVISLGYKNEERKDYDLSKLPYEKVHY